MSTFTTIEFVKRKRIKIHAPIFTIFKRLGLTPEHVKEITITPTEARVTLYRINEAGHKYADPKTRKPATETRTFDIQTSRTNPDYGDWIEHPGPEGLPANYRQNGGSW